ncbi:MULTISPECIES: hypothetical protein [Streptomyces]|uniref:hypothetical protein n=1 Tax=Streptomyces TaxID=1883 RepID=UPI001E2CAF66|nr:MULTISPECIES: hypothetical protein [Streptomyces]UFQ19820.1 hypothetical protein J2N69_35380 [Streptomyces huasconensis]WCL89443.1 hypothetical protein PPN52_35325 [Streptomyces sp. JCM 35825]
MTDVSARLADASDRPVLERLWLLFQHDMSEFSGVLPHPDGTFRSERLEAAVTRADWAPYLLTSGTAPDIAGDAWTEERRPVPGRPGLPPDSWITFASPPPPDAQSRPVKA